MAYDLLRQAESMSHELVVSLILVLWPQRGSINRKFIQTLMGVVFALAKLQFG